MPFWPSHDTLQGPGQRQRICGNNILHYGLNALVMCTNKSLKIASLCCPCILPQGINVNTETSRIHSKILLYNSYPSRKMGMWQPYFVQCTLHHDVAHQREPQVCVSQCKAHFNRFRVWLQQRQFAVLTGRALRTSDVSKERTI